MALNTVRMAVVTLVALVLQTTLFTDLRIGGVTPELVLALAAMAGFVAGPQPGAWAGFAMGLAYDVVLETPLGLAALAFCIVGYVAGLAGETAFRPTWWYAAGSVAVLSAFGVIVFAVVSTLVGQNAVVSGSLIKVIVGVAVLNALLAPAIMGVVRWSYGRPRELRTTA